MMVRLALAVGFMLTGVSVASSAAPDPLRLIPDKADLVIKIENPRAFLEGIKSLDAVKDVTQLDVVRKALDSAEARRFFELIAYYERDLGHPWPVLVDKLAGGGIVIGSKINNGIDDPVLFVVQSTDEKLLAKFIEKATAVIEDELALSGGNNKLVKQKYEGFDTLSFGNDLHACRIDGVLIFSNKPEALKKGIDQHRQNISQGGKPAENMLGSAKLAAGRKLLPADPQVWVWYNFDYIKNRDEVKDNLKTPRDNAILTGLFAGYLDVIRRSEFLVAGLYRNKDGYALTVRMPAGRDGMAEDVDLHVPRESKVSGTLPLLEPKGVLFSHSFYLDLGAMWTKREKIFNANNARDFEKGVKEASRFLPGASIDKLLTQSGVHHRFVVAEVSSNDYKVEPLVKLPSFGFVTSMRDKQFGKSVETLIRGAGFLVGTQVSLKMFEETHNGVAIVGYRFPEDGKFPDDPQKLRFNFTPTFAMVDDQFIAASSKSLCRELIDTLKKEDRTKGLHPNMQMRGYADGLGKFINAAPDALLIQSILDQAIPEGEAKKQVEQLLRYINKLGTVRIETDYLDNEFRFDLQWKTGK